jgi:hypothetical protein
MARRFECPATGRPCEKRNCNYTISAYCIRRSQEELEFWRAKADMERKRVQEQDRKEYQKKYRQERKKRLLAEALKRLDF